ncbi:MAG TPA: 2-oxo acid dehydrogenase subunit E2 [Clostridiaceae bacterium]|nr:2-oxo acid dehydrogenase subunit E2 [Clostridiaceae bacterium]
MATAIFMPKQGMSMTEGVLVNWLVEEGDNVEANQPIMEIETDKISMEAEAPASGKILSLLTKPGETVPVLSTMGWIGEEGEVIPEKSDSSDIQKDTDEKQDQDQDQTSAESTDNEFINLEKTYTLATPYAKYLANTENLNIDDISKSLGAKQIFSNDVFRYAKENKIEATPVAVNIAEINNIDLKEVAKTITGKIRKQDVLDFIDCKNKREDAQQLPDTIISEDDEIIPINNMRRVIGQRMSQSSREIPAVTQVTIVDVTELLTLRRKINDEMTDDIHFTINDFIMKSVIKTSMEFPGSRSSIIETDSGEMFRISANVNLGVAVGMESGLLVPVIHNANKLSLTELSARMKEIIQKINHSKLLPDDMSGQTITVTNLGAFGIDVFTPIINQPDSLIVGIGAVYDKLYLDDNNNLEKRNEMKISLTYDHRILDGLNAAKFSLRLKQLLESPLNLLV